MMSAVIAFCSPTRKPVRLEIGLDQLGMPARVVGLGHQEHDVEDLMHRGEFAQVIGPHLGVDFALPQRHVQAVCAHRLDVRRPLVDQHRRRGPALVRSAATQLPFAPVPRTAIFLFMTYPG